MLSLVLSIVICLGLFSSALGHGGLVHNWTFVPAAPYVPLKPFVNQKYATCSNFQPLNVGINKVPIPFFNTSPNTTLNISGSVDLYTYLDGNCTDVVTLALQPILSIHRMDTGAPYAYANTAAFGYTGSCANLVDLYRINASMGDNRFNLLWWSQSFTDGNGLLAGGAPNVGSPVPPSQPGAVNSLLIVFDARDGPAMCCNMVYLDMPTDAYYSQGAFCRTPAPPPPSPPTPPSPSPSPKPPSPKPSPRPPRPRPPPRPKSPPPVRAPPKMPPPSPAP